MDIKIWRPNITLDALDEKLENAYRRLAGSIGFDIVQDRLKASSLSRVGGSLTNSVMETSGPLLLRLGRSAGELSGVRLGGTVSLKDCASEILYEFYTEGTAAFQEVRAALYASADTYLSDCKFDDPVRKQILECADGAFAMPTKDAFTREADPFVKQIIAPGAIGWGAGIAVGAGLILLIRVPHISFVLGLIAGCAAFYFARKHHREKAERMVRQLPLRLYDHMAGMLKANMKKYADTVNATKNG